MNLTKNASKTTERQGLAVCGSLCGEKKFLKNIYPVLLVWSKKVV